MSEAQVEKTSKWEAEKLNGSKYGYERYMTAKYYKNLTDSQYNSTKRASFVESGYKRESLNPAINLARLRQRIATTEAIAGRYTEQQRDWVRLSLRGAGRTLWKYKFNYAFKFILLYKAFSEFRNYHYLSNNTVMTGQVQIAHFYSTVQWGAIAALAVLLV